MPTERIVEAYAATMKSWTGCHWCTSFGIRKLDLNGLTSRQALLLADATSGIESKAWEEASRWLKEVESEALLAREFGSRAMKSIANADWRTAIEQIEQAAALESRYPVRRNWRALAALIAREKAALMQNHE